MIANNFKLEDIYDFTRKSLECATSMADIESAINRLNHIHPTVVLGRDIAWALRCGNEGVDYEGFETFKINMKNNAFNYNRKCHINTVSESISEDIINILLNSFQINEYIKNEDLSMEENFTDMVIRRSCEIAVQTRRGPGNYVIIPQKVWDKFESNYPLDKDSKKINGRIDVILYNGELQDKFDAIVYYSGDKHNTRLFDNGLIVGIDKIDADSYVWYDINKVEGWFKYYSIIKFVD